MSDRQGHNESFRYIDGDTFNVDPHGPSSFSPRVNHNNKTPTMPQRLPTQEDFVVVKSRQGLTASGLKRQSHSHTPSSQQNFVW